VHHRQPCQSRVITITVKPCSVATAKNIVDSDTDSDPNDYQNLTIVVPSPIRVLLSNFTKIHFE